MKRRCVGVGVSGRERGGDKRVIEVVQKKDRKGMKRDADSFNGKVIRIRKMKKWADIRRSRNINWNKVCVREREKGGGGEK